MAGRQLFVCAVLSDGSEETITVLPKNWLIDDKAYWSNDKKFHKKHYRDCVDIQTGWTCYNLVKILHTSGNTKVILF